MRIPTPKAGRVHVAEDFCPPRFTKRAERLDLNPGIAMDLTVGWDLNDPRHIAAAWRYLKEVKPYLLVGSPECKAFSQLAALNRGKPGYDAALKEGLAHLRITCEMYAYQHRQGRLFLHEHPWAASSWGLKMLQAVLDLPGVERVRADQCMFG